jgi:hypothetical protein
VHARIRLGISFFAEFFPEDLVFSNQMLNSILPLPIDPASQNKKRYLQGMQDGFHANSGRIFWKLTASRIPDPKSITTEKACFQEFLDYSFTGIYSRAEFFYHTPNIQLKNLEIPEIG